MARRRCSTTSEVRPDGDRARSPPAAGPAASRRGPRGPCRRTAPASGCAGSASRSSPGCRRRSPFSPRSMRWRTPKRCCSSTTARRRSRKATSFWKRACVPTRIAIFACGQRRELGRALGALVAAGQDLEPHAGRLGQRRQREEVLAGEDLGRRHHRRLPAGLDRGQHGEERDQRLAGADVALQQPVHPEAGGHVGGDLGHGAGPARRSGGGGARRAPAACRRPSPRVAKPLARFICARAIASVIWWARSSS